MDSLHFPSPEEFVDKRMKRDTSSLLRCSLCQLPHYFFTRERLDEHIFEIHTNAISGKCPNLGDVFDREDNMALHMRACLSATKRTTSQLRRSNRNAANIANITNTPPSMESTSVIKGKLESVEESQSKLYVNSLYYRCTEGGCQENLKLPNRGELIHHLATVHQMAIEDRHEVWGLFACSKCPYVSEDRQVIQEHIAESTRNDGHCQLPTKKSPTWPKKKKKKKSQQTNVAQLQMSNATKKKVGRPKKKLPRLEDIDPAQFLKVNFSVP